MSSDDDIPSSEESPDPLSPSQHLSSIKSVFQVELTRTFGEDSNPAVELRSDSSVGLPSARFQEMRESSEAHQRYRFKGEIGRGGMGAVLKIFDTDLRRDLAMKVILNPAGVVGEASQTTSPQLVRFLEEAQVTGQLDHPGVVPVHELGVDAEGQVYFTMRLVKGQELSKIIQKVHDADPDWSLTRALGALLKVCEAMSYAHSKGVVHRDLKPANIMVGRYGQVYVMDWGLARVEGRKDSHDLRVATDPLSVSIIRTDRTDSEGPDSDSPLMTMDGQVIGTPFYMPPEQAAGRLEEIGPHSDVYALGAMLYHLLTGRLPYHMPGDRVSASIILARVLQGPPTSVHDLAPRVSPELEAICEKAMARDIRQRYADMGELAEDLRAYLENRVVQAYRTGALIELRKWVQRNRALAMTAAASLFLIVGGSTTAAIVLGAKNEEVRDARDAALLAGESEMKARIAAEEARDASESVTDLLVNQFEVLKAEETRGRPVQVSELLRHAADSLEGELGQSSLDSARLRAVVGNGYHALGLYKQAEQLLERAWRDRVAILGEDALASLESQNDLGDLYVSQSLYGKAETLLLGALEKRSELLEADDLAVLTSLHNLGQVYSNQGRYGEAEPLLSQAVEGRRAALGDDDRLTCKSVDALAGLFLKQARYEDAEAILQLALETRRSVLGENDLLTLRAMNNLARLKQDMGELDEAEPLLLEAFEKSIDLFGELDPWTVISQRELAFCIHRLGRTEEAVPLILGALDNSRVVLGENHVHTLIATTYLARMRKSQGMLDEAEKLYVKAYERRRVVLGEDNHNTLIALDDLGSFYRDRGVFDKAEQLLSTALQKKAAALDPGHPSTLNSLYNLAALYEMRGRDEECEEAYRQVFDKRRVRLGPSHPDTVSSLRSLALFYASKERWKAAAPLLREWRDRMSIDSNEYESAKTLVERAELGAKQD